MATSTVFDIQQDGVMTAKPLTGDLVAPVVPIDSVPGVNYTFKFDVPVLTAPDTYVSQQTVKTACQIMEITTHKANGAGGALDTLTLRNETKGGDIVVIDLDGILNNSFTWGLEAIHPYCMFDVGDVISLTADCAVDTACSVYVEVVNV